VFLFSVRGELKRLAKMERCLVQRKAVHERPEIEHVSLGRALGVKALKCLLAQVDREGRFRASSLAVDGTWAATLGAATAQALEQSQMVEHLFHGHLLSHEGEVDARARQQLFGHGQLDRIGCGRYARSGRRDHFFRRRVLLVAHGFFVFGECGGGGRVSSGEVVGVERTLGLPDGEASLAPGLESPARASAVSSSLLADDHADARQERFHARTRIASQKPCQIAANLTTAF
jgi:hypothetical protein